MIPYGHQCIEEDDIEAVIAVLRSDWLTQGPAVEAFERALASRVVAKDVVAFSSGTAALHAAYFAAGLTDGDEFITSPLTFAATANAGLWQGARPVFCDIDPRTGNIDPAKIGALISPKTKVLVPVDYAGHPADLDAIMLIAKARGLIVIEDACHALGASYKGKKIGSIAHMTAFSFHPVKPITTGEGGAVATDSPEYARKLRQFRSHGIVRDGFVNSSLGAWYHEMQELGLNCRLTDIQAALGTSQLKKLDRFLAERRAIVERYAEELKGLPIILPTETEGAVSGWHLYPIRLRDAAGRDKAFADLRAAEIGAQVHYIPVYLHPYYQKLGYAAGACPEAEKYFRAEISLPIYPGLTAADQDFVINALKKL